MKPPARLPAPPPAFTTRKQRILAQLAVPDEAYADASPKGSVDAGIRALIADLNGVEGLVTTSSCAGRMSVFVEGRKNAADGSAEQGEVAGIGGKGAGGRWLFVSHDPVVLREEGDEGVARVLLGGGSGEEEKEGGDGERDGDGARLIHFKFEPMILHVLTASPEHAQLLLKCGHQAGFRESGAINVVGTENEPATPIVAIRSMGLGFESLVGYQTGNKPTLTVSGEYLRTLLRISDERFVENQKRIARFQAAVLEATQAPRKKDGTEWEDPQARRERKRAEGLKRKAELQNQGKDVDTADTLALDRAIALITEDFT
ncbi:methyltransferase TYW3-domain-containing protein [Xylariomycetidae sp. FL0641]|nr:methyltransferase TYW3-domain-containing protein [Xylariomycetidae sp. FL0641]